MEEPRNPSKTLLAGNCNGIDSLCHGCRTLDLNLKNISFLKLPSNPRSADGSSDPIVLREWSSSELKQNAATCEICCFFLDMAVTHEEDFTRYRIHICEVNSTSDLSCGKIFAPCIGFDGLKRNYYSGEYYWLGLDLVGYYSAPNLSEEVLLPQKLVPERANLEKIKRWFENCRQSHEGSCLEPVHEGANIIDQPGLSPYQHKTTDISVIDCSSRKIVPYNPYLGNYATLSYVWGTESGLPADFVPDCLPNHVPKTIQDALTVCKILEIPFLWVDRYCIPQNDTKERLRQIGIMDEIYYNSTLTIIAAAGDNPEHGLPGINGTPRTAEFRSVAFGRGGLVHLDNSLFVKEIQESTWNSRAWTYQEGVVSRKRLVFSESQVHFECPTDNLWEVTDVPTTGILLNIKGPAFNRQDFCRGHYFAAENRAFPPWDSTYTFRNCLNEFFGRKISYPKDTINAIAGVISWFNKRQSRVWALSGLVIDQQQRDKKYPDDWYEYSFLNALYWNHATIIKRQPGLPSWTWAGWHVDKLFSTAIIQEVLFKAFEVRRSDEYMCMQQVKAGVVSESSLNSNTWLSIKDLKPQLCNSRLYADYLFFDAWTFLAKVLEFNCDEPGWAKLRISLPNTWNSSELFLEGFEVHLSKSEMQIVGIGAEVLIMPLYVRFEEASPPRNFHWSRRESRFPALILKYIGTSVDLGVETPSGGALPIYQRIGMLELTYVPEFGDTNDVPVPGSEDLTFWTWEYLQKASGMYFEKKVFILA